VPTTTKNYSLTKPDIGGSENEWGGFLNDDLDKVDALLGGDQPIFGIDIDGGTIDGAVIEGTIDNVVLGPDTEINGKVGTLTAVDDASSMTGVNVNARELAVEKSITETQDTITPADAVTVNVSEGTMQYLPVVDPAQKITLVMTTGQSVTLALNWQDPTNPPAIDWNAQAAGLAWVGGGSPNINQGINVIQFWCMNFGTGPVVCGAYTGVVS
jgi:hypothetical protein